MDQCFFILLNHFKRNGQRIINKINMNVDNTVKVDLNSLSKESLVLAIEQCRASSSANAKALQYCEVVLTLTSTQLQATERECNLLKGQVTELQDKIRLLSPTPKVEDVTTPDNIGD